LGNYGVRSGKCYYGRTQQEAENIARKESEEIIKEYRTWWTNIWEN